MNIKRKQSKPKALNTKTKTSGTSSTQLNKKVRSNLNSHIAPKIIRNYDEKENVSVSSSMSEYEENHKNCQNNNID